MTKYTEAFKLAVVKDYLRGEDGIKSIGRRHGADKGTVLGWVAIYRAHGAEGLKKKFSHYSGEFKLSVLKHMWDNELSYRETVAIFNIRNHGCLVDWENRYQNGGLGALAPRRRGRPRKMPDTRKPPPPPDDEKLTHEALLAELKYLRMENAYLKKLKALVQAKGAPAKRK